MDFNKVLTSRHSAKNFKETGKKPKQIDVIKAVEAASKAPLAGNLPCLKYILVTDKTKIEELAQAAQQNFISKAHYVVVICSDIKFLEKYYYERAERYKKQQAGAAIENFLLKITDLGLASSWVGAFSDETVKRILKIPEDIDIEAILPVGYEKERPTGTKEPREPNMDSILFFDKYKNKFQKPEQAPEFQ